MSHPPRHRRRGLRTFGLYVRVLVYEFRVTLLLVLAAVALATVLFALTPMPSLGGRAPDVSTALYAGWRALFSETVFSPPPTWYLAAVNAFYPLVGIVLVGEGIVRLGMLMVSRRRGEKEWMRVMASTYRDHVVLCGIGRLGYRVLERLLEQHRDVVVVEKNADARFLDLARSTGVPVLVRDMTEDAALVEAGVPYASAIVLATNDDIGNLSTATDARRMNPSIRICLRMYDQEVAAKLATVFGVDVAFSASALAASAVAGMTLGARVLSTCQIAGVAHVATELVVQDGSTLVGCQVADIESAHAVRVLARIPGGGAATESPPAVTARLAARDLLVVHAPVATLPALADAARGR